MADNLSTANEAIDEVTSNHSDVVTAHSTTTLSDVKSQKLFIAFKDLDYDAKIRTFDRQVQQLQHLENNEEKEQHSGYVGWLAYQIYLESPKAERLGWLETSRHHFLEAYDLDSGDTTYVEMLCIVLISLVDIVQDVETSLLYSGEFKKFLDIGLLEPENEWDSQWLLLSAKFIYKVQRMSNSTRRAAESAGIPLPSETLDEAIEKLIVVSTGDCQPIETELMLAKCYFAQDKPQSARRWLNKVIVREASNAVELDSIVDAKLLLE